MTWRPDPAPERAVSTSAAALAVVTLAVRPLAEVNAALGRDYGDAVLQAIANRAQDRLGPGGSIERIAGDQFALMLPDGEPGLVEALVRTLLADCDKSVTFKDFSVAPRVVAGIACRSREGEDVGVLLDRAEFALHQALAGDQRIVRYEPDLARSVRRRLRLVGDLENALSRNELFLYFQPAVEIGTGRVQSVEALVRWDHPVLGVIPPGEFIAVAEQTPLMSALTERVLALALDHCAGWRAGDRDLPVAVNVSAPHLVGGSLPDVVERLLTGRRLEGRHLKLEITETALMNDLRAAAGTLRRLQEMGVTVTLDDFGTGYSSLAYIRDLPLGEVKIDRAFTLRAPRDRVAETIVSAVVGIADVLGIATVAEGIEDQEALDCMRRLGCRFAQGFHIARPLAPAALLRWLQAR